MKLNGAAILVPRNMVSVEAAAAELNVRWRERPRRLNEPICARRAGLAMPDVRSGLQAAHSRALV
jgi:hypothetical protein